MSFQLPLTHCLVLCVTVEPLRNAYSEDSEMLRPAVLLKLTDVSKKFTAFITRVMIKPPEKTSFLLAAYLSS
jgi:hypothetical protein